MIAEVTSLHRPNPDVMRAHVEHLFGGFLDGFHDGMIELAWTDTTPDAGGRYRLRHAQMFHTDALDQLIATAVARNSTPNCNVYIGAWLRHPETPPMGRAQDVDAWALTAAYVDCDEAFVAANAKNIYQGDKPTWITITGLHPHTRAQLWWRLQEPLIDHDRASALLRGMAVAHDADTSVVNPSRVMRLAGSVAWPAKPGRIVEVTSQAAIREAGLPAYMAEHLECRFPPVIAPQVGGVNTGQATQRGGALGIGKIQDGRERYMRDTTVAVLLEYIGSNGCAPTAQELFDDAWPQYERNVDLRARPGRGKEEFAEKCAYTVRRFEEGKIRGVETVDKAIEVWKGRQSARRHYARAAAEAPATTIVQDRAISTVNFLTLMTEEVVEEPDYIEPSFAGPGGFVLIAGPPKAQKSFLLQELLVSAATGSAALAGALTVPRPLRVFYLQAEMNRKLLRKRAREFKLLPPEQKEQLRTNLIVSERFFMLLNDDGVKTAVETINASFPDAPPDIIAVDPLANLFDGENENDNAQIMRFLTGRIEAVRQAVNPLACVIMVHHSRKVATEDMARDPFVAIRGAGALRGYYDSCIVIYRKSEEEKTRRVHFELRGGEAPEPMTVELAGGRFRTVAEGLAEIDMAKARQILKAIDAAWKNGQPWSLSKQATKARQAVRRIIVDFGIGKKAAEDMLEQWQINGILAERERFKRGGLWVPGGLEVTQFL